MFTDLPVNFRLCSQKKPGFDSVTSGIRINGINYMVFCIKAGGLIVIMSCDNAP